MLTGVEILLERMKTNPEEFVEGGYSKWSRVMDAGWSVMTVEEQKALQDALTEAKREQFNGEVMRVLAQGHADEEVTMDSEPYIGRKHLMQGNSGQNRILTPQSIATQANQLLRDEMDKQRAGQYAGQNTANNQAWWDGTSPYQQRK